MARRIALAGFVTALAGLLAIGVARPAAAIGYFNVPGSFCQCMGYGNGAGHHSCLVLGPVSCQGFCSTHEVRVECPPQPPYAYYNNGYYAAGNRGGGSNGTWIQESVPVQFAPQQFAPQQFAPQPTPAAEPLPTPTPAAMRPQVQRQPRVW